MYKLYYMIPILYLSCTFDRFNGRGHHHSHGLGPGQLPLPAAAGSLEAPVALEIGHGNDAHAAPWRY